MIVSTKGLVQVEFEGRGDKECERTQKHHREGLEAHEKKGEKRVTTQTLLRTQVRWPCVSVSILGQNRLNEVVKTNEVLRMLLSRY